jgi:hypothetical protein
MPPELKKPITKLDEMTCENCVFSATRKEFGDPKSDRSYIACHCGDNEYYLDGIRGQGNFCSQGAWLLKEVWRDEETGDEREVTYVERFGEIYGTFVRHNPQRYTENLTEPQKRGQMEDEK